MITADEVKMVAQLLAGDSPGWQTRFGKMTGFSRGHVSNLLAGTRPVTLVVAKRVIAAAQAETAMLRARADKIESTLGLDQWVALKPLPFMKPSETKGEDK